MSRQLLRLPAHILARTCRASLLSPINIACMDMFVQCNVPPAAPAPSVVRVPVTFACSRNLVFSLCSGVACDATPRNALIAAYLDTACAATSVPLTVARVGLQQARARLAACRDSGSIGCCFDDAHDVLFWVFSSAHEYACVFDETGRIVLPN